MLIVKKPAELRGHVGTELASDWLLVDQKMIDGFAQVTGDDQWIHIDAERAAREAPGGQTIAHGYLTLSLLPILMRSTFRVEERSRALNYGSNKVRFTAPVPSGSRIRLRQTIQAVEPVEGGVRLISGCLVEIENGSRPALAAEIISLIFD